MYDIYHLLTLGRSSRLLTVTDKTHAGRGCTVKKTLFFAADAQACSRPSRRDTARVIAGAQTDNGRRQRVFSFFVRGPLVRRPNGSRAKHNNRHRPNDSCSHDVRRHVVPSRAGPGRRQRHHGPGPGNRARRQARVPGVVHVRAADRQSSTGW